MVNGFGEEMVVMKPAWLEGLIAETFFAGCGAHENHRKNEKNVFCLDCCLSICPHCLPSHSSHPLLQVRRYVYHDVVRLGDLEKLIDCSYIQPYTINSAKVIFLKQRPQSRSSKCSSNICSTCERILQERFQFCSLSCKVDHMVSGGEDLSRIIYTYDKSDFAYSEFEGLRSDGSYMMDEDGQATPDSILEDPLQQYKLGSSCGSGGGCSDGGGAEEPTTTTTRKKKGSRINLAAAAGIPGLSLGSRRKGNPHRSPFS